MLTNCIRDTERLLDEIPERVFLIVIILTNLLVALILFYGFYPGGLCRDTVSIIHYGVTSEYTNNDPPVLQMLAGLAYSIYANQAPLLLMQLGGYFLGIFFLSFYFVKIQKRLLAIFMIFISLYPYNIFLHAMVIKDVGLMVVWLNIFALSISSMIIREKRYRLTILIVNIALLLFGILIRDNSFIATPALLFLILYAYNADLFKIKSWPSKIVFVTGSLLFAFFFMKGVNGLLLSDNMENRDYKKTYLIEQLFKYDLIGMSVLNGHSGITSGLSKKDQYQIERIYNILPIYWTVKIDEKLFEKNLDIFAAWKKTVIHHPFLYIRHRFHIFRKTFGDYEISHLMWVRQAEKGSFKNKMLLFNEIPPDKFYTPRWHENNIVYRAIKAYLEWYFKLLGSSLPFALLGVMMILHSSYILYVKKQNLPAVKIIHLVNVTAFLYYIPYLFFAHQAETRYVYPSIVLIILTVPLYFAHVFMRHEDRPKEAIVR